jgi:phosphatidylserine/phosphatidylglycerophosphate/cardiolipin synthase-like enzyme
MALARDALIRTLQLLEEGLNPFLAEDARKALNNPDSVQLIEQIGRTTDDENCGEVCLRLLLQTHALRSAEIDQPQDEVELVATLPALVRGVRPTRTVVRELIESAQREIIAVGYQISDAELIDDLAGTSRRGVRLVLISDRSAGAARGLGHKWPTDLSRPEIYVNVEDADDEHRLMHGKMIVADGREMLITSANLTFHGMEANMEFGARISGPQVETMTNLLKSLLDSEFLEKQQ